MSFTDTLIPTAARPQARSLYEMLIRDDPSVDAIVTDDDHSLETIQHLLLVSIVGFLLYGSGVGLAAQLFLQRLALGDGNCFGNVPLLTIPLALTGAFLLALLVCLPSFYFYTQLSGIDASFRLITAQALRVQARTAVLLLGALPLYVAVVLAGLIGAIETIECILLFGLALPFVVGLAGLRSLQRSFARLAAILPVAHTRRVGFLPRMIFAWGVVYSAVCPIALFRIGGLLAGLTN